MTRDSADASNQSWWLNNLGPDRRDGNRVLNKNGSRLTLALQGQKCFFVQSYLSSVGELQHSLRLLPESVLEDDDWMLTRSILKTWMIKYVYDSWYWSIALSHDKCTICFYKDNNCSGKVSQITRRKAHLKYISEVSWHGAQDNFVGCDSWPVSTGQSHVHEILKKVF